MLEEGRSFLEWFFVYIVWMRVWIHNARQLRDQASSLNHIPFHWLFTSTKANHILTKCYADMQEITKAIDHVQDSVNLVEKYKTGYRPPSELLKDGRVQGDHPTPKPQNPKSKIFFSIPWFWLILMRSVELYDFGWIRCFLLNSWTLMSSVEFCDIVSIQWICLN